ncbi:carbohydrate ABC transporter permease [Microlunatus parietis]|uniref:ABC-type sugar transport system permease subunit n=1 Tax=Microlunatus parietis TaxID=682979 RepID=A0A7Y9IA75_9ACTN|nr:sugar ABC transporter permease [Microlunatus parietis]NYE72634.1 ABC-type sugar transport system permease subunit [Microlunatus parietis]
MATATPSPPGTAAPPRPARTAAPRRTGRLHRSNLIAYLMLAPLMVLLAIFVIIPFFQAASLSFFDFSFYLPSTFIGFDNYRNVLSDPIFTQSIVRGLLFMVLVVPIGLVLAFVFASVVKGMGRRLASFVKTSIYLPTIVSGVIASIVFILIFDYYGGILNWFLDLLVSPFREFEPIPWLGDPATALPSLAVPAVWIGFGVTALIMLAGMLDIPDSYYESASLDGATWWQQTIHITIPMLKNVLIYLLIAGCTGAIQQFELPLIMTGGGPLNSTMMPNLYIFQHFTQDQRQGQPLAAALMLFVVLGLVSALIFRFINSEKTQEG